MNNPAWAVRTLSVPGDDTDLSLWVAFDNARFCFGAGEGTQRAFIQKRLRMSGLQAIFLPDGVSARCGLPGMIMTAADQGSKDLTVVGPPDTNAFIASLRSSVQRDAFQVNGVPFPRDSTAPSELLYENPRLTVYGVALRPEERTTSLEASKLPPRPTTLSAAEADAYAAAIVQEMFGRKSGLPRPQLNAPPVFPTMRSYAAPDDRYPIPVPSDADVATDMVYICRTPDTRGKFNAALAKQLNIPNGPIRAQLTRGEAIEYDDPTAPGGRRRVTPEECLVGGGPGAILVVVNCREHNLERLLASTAFTTYQTAADGAAPQLKVHSIVHRVPLAVWEDKRYQAWMQSFGPTTAHYFANTASTHEIFFAGSTWNAFRLNMIDPNIFPVPHHLVKPLPAPTLAENASVLQVNHLLKMHPAKPAEILPNHEKDVAFPTTLDGLSAARDDLSKQGLFADFVAAAKAAQESVAAAEAKRAVTPAPGDDIVVTTLGTGSAIPSKYRNVSATYVDIPDVGGILLDCGEGTLGQMRRRWGPEGMKKVYNDLKLINVSHMHADHHLGLCSILADRFKHGVTAPLYIIAPHAIALQLSETGWWQDGVPREALENVKWLNSTRLRFPWSPRTPETPEPRVAEAFTPEDAHSDPGAFCELSTIEDVAASKRKWPFQNVFRFSTAVNNRFHDVLYAMIDDLGLKSIHTPAVSHRGAAYGLVVEHKSGWKLAYSGDTMPCESFVEAASGATILIHEATIEDDKPDVAEKKGHSTFGQAIDVGTRMNAKYIILNHFSQRYPKAPNLQLSENGPTVAISFDFMSLRAADSWKMAHYMDAINILFAGEEAEDPEGDAAEERVDGGKEDAAKAKGGKDSPAAHGRTKKADRKAAKTERREKGARDDAPPQKTGYGLKRGSSASDEPNKRQRSTDVVMESASETPVEPAEPVQPQDGTEKMDVDSDKPKAVAGAQQLDEPVQPAVSPKRTTKTVAGWRVPQ